VKDLQEAGAKIVPVSPNTVDLRNALQILAKQEGITRILSEGGATLAAGLIQLNLVDDFIVTRAPKLIGSAGISAIGDLGLASLAEAPYFTRIEILPLGNDIAEIYRK
jgi:diaminohydroxyphosphoribosylaminopyrimidine deaminase/5-amino-6-(5-phosphoribosylamino)uracil reductase